MNDNREVESTDEGQLLPANGRLVPPGLGEEWKIHRRDGYFVGVAGWSGLTFWLIGKLTAFVTSGVVWGVLLTIGWIAADETVRTTVRSILGEDQKIPMTDDEGRKFPLLATDAYQQLSTMWKQVLAEVQINQSNYPSRLVTIVRELTLNDIAILDHIAPYVVGNSIIQADDFEMGYDIPSVKDVDFERLKTIGITTEGQFGMYKDITPKDGQPAQHWFGGTTLALAVRASDPTMEFKIHVISLTEEGEQIIRLLNKPTSLKAICKIASRLKERKEIGTFIFARFESEPEGKSWSNREGRANVSELCSRYGVPAVD